MNYLFLLICLYVSTFCLTSATFAADQPPLGTSDSKSVEITASDSLEWYQEQKIYVARGQARAVRGDLTVDADLLTAHQRDKSPSSGTPSKGDQGNDTSMGDIDMMTANGHVIITDPREHVYGDHAVYDLNQHVIVVTGKNLKYETEKDVVTARDQLEYWEEKKIAVARGQAVAVHVGRHVEADVLTAAFRDNGKNQTELWKITGEGHVIVITKSDISHGDNMVYDVTSNIAVLRGHVRVTRQDGTVLNGDVGEVDFKTNRSRLLNEGKGRVRALLGSKTGNPSQSSPSQNTKVNQP